MRVGEHVIRATYNWLHNFDLTFSVFLFPGEGAGSVVWANKASLLLCPHTSFFFCLSSLRCRMLEYSLNLQNVSLSAVRTVRVLRPLRAINRVPSEFRLLTSHSSPSRLWIQERYVLLYDNTLASSGGKHTPEIKIESRILEFIQSTYNITLYNFKLTFTLVWVIFNTWMLSVQVWGETYTDSNCNEF